MWRNRHKIREVRALLADGVAAAHAQNASSIRSDESPSSGPMLRPGAIVAIEDARVRVRSLPVDDPHRTHSWTWFARP
jgi:hypothetical protein